LILDGLGNLEGLRKHNLVELIPLSIIISFSVSFQSLTQLFINHRVVKQYRGSIQKAFILTTELANSKAAVINLRVLNLVFFVK